MTNLLAAVEIRAKSGFDEDSVINTYAFDLPDFDAEGGGGEALWTILAGIYLNDLGDAFSINEYFGRSRDTGADSLRLKLFDVTDHLDGSPHGSPIYVDNTALVSTGGDSLPEECALVLTTRANGWGAQPIETPDDADPDDKPQRPRQRYSGRIYYGPFATSAVTSAAPNYTPRPLDPILEHLRTMGEFLAVQTAIEFAGNWCVWSRADATMRAITDVQTDDAFDTQRRRGTGPSSRTNLNVVP